MSCTIWQFLFNFIIATLFVSFSFHIQEANDIAVSCMKSDSASADAVYVRGLCLYYKDNLDKGLTHFQQVLTLDPDHSKAKVMRLKAKNLKEKKENGKFAIVVVVVGITIGKNYSDGQIKYRFYFFA